MDITKDRIEIILFIPGDKAEEILTDKEVSFLVKVQRNMLICIRQQLDTIFQSLKGDFILRRKTFSVLWLFAYKFFS